MSDDHQLADDVDSRAADIMARLAARQSQRTDGSECHTGHDARAQ